MKNNIGIAGLGVYLPKPRMTAKEIAAKTGGVWTESAIIEKLGIIEKPIPGPEDGTQEMGAKAALMAIEDAKISPEEIDLILCVGEEWKEYPLTTSALYIQDRVGATNAWAIDVQNRCCTTVAALKIAKNMMQADEEINTVLIAGGYRNGDFVDYSDKAMSMMYNLSAGGGAFVLKKGLGKNLLLGSHLVADGSLSRDAGCRIGGIAEPINADNLSSAYSSLSLMNAEHMKQRLGEVTMPNWFECIDKALEKSNMTRKDVNYLAVLHFKRSSHLYMLEELGLSEEQTTYLEHYGHMGQIDQMLSLKLGLEQGKIKAGDNVMMIAAGIGYVWAANVIRWG